MSSTFGKLFTITTFGESHGGSVGVVIDGCPGGIRISLGEIQAQLNRRKPGQSHLATPRKEDDIVTCLSGLENEITLGSPITLVVTNKDQNPGHYKDINSVFRPSHADFTYEKKYGIKASSGGGRASARETIGRVAAGALAEQVLKHYLPDFSCTAFVDKVKNCKIDYLNHLDVSRNEVDKNLTRCPDEKASNEMEKIIIAAKKNGDSVGGSIFCIANGIPPGLGEPIFDKLQADLAKALMSLPATRFFEAGLGERATEMSGSEHNDEFETDGKNIRTSTNNSGGIQGGISNGMPIYTRVGFKPVATIFKEQNTVTTSGSNTTFTPKQGRHDPCVLPRAVPMVEAMVTLVLVDHFLRNRAYQN